MIISVVLGFVKDLMKIKKAQGIALGFFLAKFFLKMHNLFMLYYYFTALLLCRYLFIFQRLLAFSSFTSICAFNKAPS
jgi:hypothetical protein